MMGGTCAKQSTVFVMDI